MEIDSYNILCPYCQNICGDRDNWENYNLFDEETLDFECENCGKKFEGRQVVTIDYRTEKNCELNNEKHIKGEYQCKNCDIYNGSMKEGTFKVEK